MFARLSSSFGSQQRKALAGAGAVAFTGIILSSSNNASSRTYNQAKKNSHIVVVGGGTAGIGVAAMLRNEGVKNVTIIEPRDVHYYQPLWTLVGGGVKPVQKSAHPMKQIVGNTGANWVQERVASFDPKSNQVHLQDGSKVEYDYLVVAAGMQIDWDKVPGLKEGLEKEDSGVVSIYDYNYANKTWKTFEKIRNLAKPSLHFVMSPTPIKCAGAPQKIMWLLEDTMRRSGTRQNANFTFWTPGGGMFGVPYYSEKLEKLRQERNVDGKFKHELVSIDSDNKIATFRHQDGDKTVMVQQKFDLLHVAPHMSAPDFLKGSPLSDDKGWVDVDKHTLQSKKYKNVFGLGDCTNTPNSKTAAAITSQAPVVVHNIQHQMQGKDLTDGYSGYASCPLVIARGRTILAEFGYGGKIMETFGRDTGNFPLNMIGTEGALQQRFFYFLKEQVFPYVYWNLWTRGMWYGTNGPIKPRVTDKTEKKTKATHQLS